MNSRDSERFVKFFRKLQTDDFVGTAFSAMTYYYDK